MNYKLTLDSGRVTYREFPNDNEALSYARGYNEVAEEKIGDVENLSYGAYYIYLNSDNRFAKLSVEEKAGVMVSRTYQMETENNRHKPADAFFMFSRNRPADSFWTGFVNEAFEQGLNSDEVEALLTSKDMRWMFDQNGMGIVELGKSFFKPEYIERAKKLVYE